MGRAESAAAVCTSDEDFPAAAVCRLSAEGAGLDGFCLLIVNTKCSGLCSVVSSYHVMYYMV